jgi:hypothetical protein
MPANTTRKNAAFLSARCSKRLKLRVRHAERSTGLDESEFVRSALEEFFTRHRTPEAQLAAIRALNETAGGREQAA